MAAGQWPGGGDGGDLWDPPALPLPALESLLAGSLFPDEPSPAAAVLSFFGGSLAQLPSPPPLSAAALLGYPQFLSAESSWRTRAPWNEAQLDPTEGTNLCRDEWLPCTFEKLIGGPCMDNFDMFHEQDLAQLAAQVAQKAELQEKQGAGLHPKITPQLDYSKYSILDQADNSSSFALATSALTSQHVSSSVIAASIQDMPILPSHTDCINTGSTGVLQVLQASSITLDRPADDGYNWRKYGQKAVKGGKYPRSYYKCTLNCPVRKNVEHSADGRIVKIIYRGQHSHERPSKRFKDCGGLLNELDDFNDIEEASTRSHLDCQGYYRKPITSIGTMADRLLPTREEGDEQLSGSSDSREEGDDEIRTVGGDVGDANENERNAPGQKIIVSTTSDVDLLDDGYRWRKYGQKVVRGNPHPRSYYKCTYQGCDVKKHIERSSQEPHAVITTYEGKHIHDVPVSRNRSHATGQPYSTEQTYTEQSPASFCSSSEKTKYRTIILNHLAF